MNDENSLVDREIKENRDLSVLLSKWQPPVFPAGLDARMTEASLRTGMRPPLWKRLLAARIPVPAPVAVLTIVLLSATTFLAVRTHKPLAAPVPAITVQTRPEILVTPPIVANSPTDSRPADLPKKTNPGTAYVTHADLTGFEPVKELKIRILPKENNHER